MRIYPAVGECRQLQIVLARRIDALRIPDADGEQGPVRTGVRKPYTKRGGYK